MQPKDVQQILRAVLLQEESGHYYALYVNNEIQVKAAEWLTLLAVDRPVTLELLGKMADADYTENCCNGFFAHFSPFFRVLCMFFSPITTVFFLFQPSAEDVFIMLEQIVTPIDEIVLERLYLNKENYLAQRRRFYTHTSHGQSAHH